MEVFEVLEALKKDQIFLKVSENFEIEVSGDRSKIEQWLPEISNHKKVILSHLTFNKNDVKKPLFQNELKLTKFEKINWIKSWLVEIEEPPELHHITLNKCVSDDECLNYFFYLANIHN